MKLSYSNFSGYAKHELMPGRTNFGQWVQITAWGHKKARSIQDAPGRVLSFYPIYYELPKDLHAGTETVDIDIRSIGIVLGGGVLIPQHDLDGLVMVIVEARVV